MTEELIESYVRQGWDRSVATRYVEAGRTPPPLETWLSNGVPTGDRDLFKGTNSRDEDVDLDVDIPKR